MKLGSLLNAVLPLLLVLCLAVPSLALQRASETNKADVQASLDLVRSTRAYVRAVAAGKAAEEGLKAKAARKYAEAAYALPSHTDTALKAARMLFELEEELEAAQIAALARDAAADNKQRMQASQLVEKWRPYFNKVAEAQFTTALRRLKAGQAKAALTVLERIAPLILNRNEGFVALVAARYAAGNPRRALGMVKQWVRSRPDKLEPIAQTRVAVYYGTDIVNRVLADAKIDELLKDAFGVRAVARLSQQIAKNKTYEEPSGMFETRVNPKDGAEMALIPAGEFLMGDDDISDNPRRAVRLSGYWMYKKPVTVGQYKKFCQDTARKMPDAPSFNPDWVKEDHPIVNVSWEDAQAYCTWAGTRLPTEAEWEKAARGTDGRKFPWGNEFDNSKLWSSVNEKRCGTVPAGTYADGVSPYGILDMAGNVWQWCADWYDTDYRRTAPATDPKDMCAGQYRVLRGGSWYFFNQGVFRSAYRERYTPDYKDNTYGFRCALSAHE